MAKPKGERVDQALVRLRLVRSRHQAQELIKVGAVQIFGKPVSSPAASFTHISEGDFKIAEHPLIQYVSRGGWKLQGALEKTKLVVENQVCLDIGISTGGFADCLLQKGALHVYGIDVGSEQLSPSLVGRENLAVRERINARDLTRPLLRSFDWPEEFDLVTVDCSFVSLEHILGRAGLLLKKNGRILALVKPQFEVGKQRLSRAGVVKDAALFPLVEEKIRSVCQTLHLRVDDYFESEIEGSDGNQEFFVLATGA